jgi:hypothetical protein
MPAQIDDLSHSLVALEQDTTLIAAVELSQSSWFVGAIVPGLERHRTLPWVDRECSASRRALARARFAAYGLDPSAFPVSVARHGVGAGRRRSGEERQRAYNAAA